MTLLVLDFDGVLCDSVDETALTGWNAAGEIWPDLARDPLPPEILAGFREARPVIETGYETIFVLRLLADGVPASELAAGLEPWQASLWKRAGCDMSELKTLFGTARDRWLSAAPESFANANPFFPGVIEWLRTSVAAGMVYVVTTKERRFVEYLLSYHLIMLPPDRLVGLESGRPKEDTLELIAGEQPGVPTWFVEDRLATLERCQDVADRTGIRLALAAWGYNTPADRAAAQRLKIPVWELTDLLCA